MKNPGPSDYRVLEASRGYAWLMQSLAMLRSQGARLLLIALLLQIIVSLVQLPLLGILIVLSVPALSAGLLEAFHRAALGRPPGPGVLFVPLLSARHLGRFFATGGLLILISFLCISTILGSTLEVDEALLLRLQQGDATALEEIDPLFMTRLLMAFAVSLAIGGTLTFFSIPLVWFRDYKLGAALGRGMRALVANWKPMLVLGLAMFVFALPMFLLMLLLMQLAAWGPVGRAIGMGAMMVILLLFQLLLFGTQYCSFRDIFAIEKPVTDEPPPDDGQLLA